MKVKVTIMLTQKEAVDSSIMTYYAPVSYTHLDVYKRQGVHSSL